MARSKTGMPKVTPNLSKGKPSTQGEFKPMTQSGFCQFGPGSAHVFCSGKRCTCPCHSTPKPEAT